MTRNTMQSLATFEDLQQHMDSFDLDAFDNDQQTLLPRSIVENIDHLAAVWEMVQPVLTVVGALPILPARWRRALALLTGAIETVLAVADDDAFKAGRDLEEVDAEAREEVEGFKAGRDLEE